MPTIDDPATRLDGEGRVSGRPVFPVYFLFNRVVRHEGTMRSARAGLLGLAILLLAGEGPARAQKKAPPEPVVNGKAISVWIKTLAGKEALPRVQAINALIQAGPEARRAVPALIALFRDSDATFLHPLAAVALSRVGASAVPEVEKALKDKAAAVRGGAALALGLIGAEARPAVPGLAAALKDGDPLVRTAAAQALGNIGSAARPALTILRSVLEDRDMSARLEAAAALWKIGNDARGVAVLQAALQDADSPTCPRAVAIAGEMGTAAKSASGELKSLLAAKDVNLRLAAAEARFRVTREVGPSLAVLQPQLTAREISDRRLAIAALGTLASEKKASGLLADLLSDQHDDIRREAACALAERGADLAAVRKTLVMGLRDPDVGVRWWCALALAAGAGEVRKEEEDLLRAFRAGRAPAVGAETPPARILQDVQTSGVVRAVPALAEMIRQRSGRLQREAAWALASLGLDGRPALPALTEILQADDKILRRAAADALGQMGTEALGPLTRLLGNPDARMREGAVRGLGQVGLPARSTLPALVRLLKDDASTVRTQAALAVWNVGQNADAALPVLNHVLKDVDNQDRWEALDAIGIIAHQARPAIRGLTEILVNGVKDRDPRVRAHAAKWLFRRTRQAKVVVPLLRDLVTDRDAYVRQVAIEALAEMEADPQAVPLLLVALEDREVTVRLAASEGLARGGAVALSVLTEALKNKSARIRLGVVRALAMLGPAAAKAAPALHAMKKDEDAAVRAAVDETLARIGTVRRGG